ncbi:hypothetical protein B0H94_10413 [Salsuginibacillus halophilus]|uniref:Uncharacterized protein n=1 Tax=Salsuginibacillus halophilus TaxID=517424 RepID=A0A2P8HQB0_9BACI|nr:hypothetical protein B0H94_10413 [Salsuginibacillus halophilus]
MLLRGGPNKGENIHILEKVTVARSLRTALVLQRTLPLVKRTILLSQRTTLEQERTLQTHKGSGQMLNQVFFREADNLDGQ